MKDYSEARWRESRPTHTAEECLQFCLDQLFKDRRHTRTQEVVHHLTFEELIGALLHAEDAVNELKELKKEK